ncbi:MAG TPA: hypothetical protein VFC19_16040 [Candidatus Limnocylindrales bacterium]|nr:hypothetical protein [Candidatus Limnocylindrales bacterium]
MTELLLTGVKIGGSLITASEQEFSPDLAAIAAIAEQLAAASEPIVVVHGMGTYGRATMPLHEGAGFRVARWQAARRALRLMLELNSLFVEALWRAGVQPSPLDPASIFVLEPIKGITRVATEVILEHVRAGRTPVLHGGTFLHTDGTHRIISSDTMLARLGEELPMRHAIWATDVPGVLGVTSANTPGGVISVLDNDDLPIWQPEARLREGLADMHQKVACARQLARAGVPSVIFDGRRAGLILAALTEPEKVPGTLVK